MRQSRYTVVVEDEDCHLLFNAATGAIAALGSDAFADFERCEGAHAAELLAAGFLTELTADEELAAQEAIFEAQAEDHTELTLSLAPTYACNLRCPYCYEQGHNGVPGKMSAKIRETLYRFIEARHADTGFSRLSVQWYGGDPSLALDVVEDISMHVITWCDERDIEYGAMMLTNCNLIDELAVEMLARARVSEVLVTIDGFEETHNKRRVSAVGLNSYERNIEAVRLFTEYGINVRAIMNVDHVNWPEFYPLHDMLNERFGIELGCARLCDYGHFFGTRDFTPPAFDLLGHNEFSRLTYEAFMRNGIDASGIQELLAPTPRFCNGQRHDYFVIDSIGDVYLCDGVLGEKGRVAFNICDDPSAWVLDGVSHNPHESAQCRACHLLPLCQGNCNWERHATGMHCHPLLTTLPDYLRAWHRLSARQRS